MGTNTESILADGPARSSIAATKLAAEDLESLDGFWRAANYLAAGMIYLRDNALLSEPLELHHLKRRLLGHWGSSPGLAFVYTHLNRVIYTSGVEALFVAGPGHGAPGVIAPAFLEGGYAIAYPQCGTDVDGIAELFRRFSFPGGVGSHCTPETPGSLHEGGELGYSLSHAVGAAFDNPNLIVACVVGDGEAETGPLATAWHGSKFLNPMRDGAVLPILHLNGYKISGPTLLARMDPNELAILFRGYGWAPYFVEGSEPASMHEAMAATLDHCVKEIGDIRERARTTGAVPTQPRWPMIILRTPKGWTGPATVDGHRVEGSWRAHQVPIADMANPTHLAQLESWLHSYRPEQLFKTSGELHDRFRRFVPPSRMQMSTSKHANGGLLRVPLDLPSVLDFETPVDRPGRTDIENTVPMARYLAEVIRRNQNNFRVFCPDETTSNRLQALFDSTDRQWSGVRLPEDDDGGHLSPDGRVMEMLSEHTLEGWLEGYLLSGRHGLLATYEAFAHVIDSMVNQHCKWLETANKILWRRPVSSLNLLITSTVWRQDHNGFTHQDPGFIDVVVNKSPSVTRIFLPPDANTLLVTTNACLQTTDLVNVIVADKQRHLQFLSMEHAIDHCQKGLGVWTWASTDDGVEPDVVLACAGDVATMETLAASELLRREFPDIAIRFVNVVDLFALANEGEHPNSIADADFESLFTADRPIVFNFHGYPWLIHRLAYRRPNHVNLHVRGYKEQGSINTPMQLAIENDVDRYSLAIDTIDRVPRLARIGAHAKNRFIEAQQHVVRHAMEFGIDPPELTAWTWPAELSNPLVTSSSAGG